MEEAEGEEEKSQGSGRRTREGGSRERVVCRGRWRMQKCVMAALLDDDWLC